MFRYFISAIFIIVMFAHSFGARCGTIMFAEDSKKAAKKTAASNCIPENYYGKVLEKLVLGEQPFIIYYTLQKAHAVKSEAYIDSLAEYLKQAYKLHKDSLGMKGILGARQTLHYKKNVPLGVYPVEVADIGLIRGYEEEQKYDGTLGLTFQSNSARSQSQIIMENDFLYGADCYGNPSTSYMTSADGFNYAQNWHLTLKMTTFHELYHAFQMAQVDINKNNSFWLEASATGVEQIGLPEFDDYINYLPHVANSLGRSMEDIDGMAEYGYAILYLFLFSEFGPRFDSAIWNYFSKYNTDNFSMQLARLAYSRGINHEDLFHKFAKSIFYSGKRIAFSDEPPFWNDMNKWPTWGVKRNNPTSLPAGAFDFMRKIKDGEPATASVARATYVNYRDSSIWIISRLLEKEDGIILDTVPQEFAAYPNPWNPKLHPKLYFKNAAKANEKEAKVEIRSANGALLKRISGNAKEPLFWEPQKSPAPGILYYRTLPYGKMRKLIVEY